MGNNLNRWTKEQIEFLKENYPNKDIKEVSLILNHSVGSIYTQVSKLGLKKSSEYLNNFYKKLSIIRKGKGNPMFGKKGWNNGLTKETDERIKKYAEKQKGKKLSEEHRLIAIKNLKPHSKTAPLNLVCNYCGNNFFQEKDKKEPHKYCSLECYHNDLKEGNMSLKTRKKMSFSLINKWKNPIYRENQIKATLNGLMKRPTKYEKRIAELCIENSLPFIYTGNGTFLINFKNPDFINEKDKIVIEVFSSYFKIRDYGSVENYKEFCRKKYNSAGWKVIFIEEEDIDEHYQKRDKWKNVCLNKILEVYNE